MLQVNIEKIIPVTEARDMFNKIVDEVEGTDEMYVLTKNGKPVAVVVGVNHLEKLTGESHEDVAAKIDAAPATTVEDGGMVFASADDVTPEVNTEIAAAPEIVPAESTSGAVADPLAAMTAEANNLPAVDQVGQIADPNVALAAEDLNEASLAPEQTASVISPIPDEFGAAPIASDENGSPFSEPAPEEAAIPVVEPLAFDTDMQISDLSGEPAISEAEDIAVDTSADASTGADADPDADSSSGPILPPRQGM